MPPRTPALLLALGLLAAPAFTLPGHAGPAPQVGCADPRGCPDMTIDLAQLAVGAQEDIFVPEGSCLIEEGYLEGPGWHHVVRMNLGAPNVGAGDLVLGHPAHNPDLFFFSACHNHYHLRDYITTRVWTPEGFLAWEQLRQAHPEWTAADTFAAHPELLGHTTRAAKISFCAIDIYPMPANQGGATVPDLPKYVSCTNQGVSRGWSDLYLAVQVGNWADATGLDPGPYMMEAEVNTLRLFEESDYTNNRGAIPVVVHACHAGSFC